jgi:hypothetical protein
MIKILFVPLWLKRLKEEVVMTNQNNKIMRGKITNTETGEVSEFEHYLFCLGTEMHTIAMIINAECYEHPNCSVTSADDITRFFYRFQVNVDCLALDSLGDIFELNLDFEPNTREEMDQILRDLVADRIFSIRGWYSVLSEHPIITIHNPIYSPLCPDFSEDEVRECFRINSQMLKTKDLNSENGAASEKAG